MQLEIPNSKVSKFRKSFLKNMPFELNILKFKITNACNSKCLFCDYWKTKNPQFFDFELFCQVIKTAKKLGLQKITLSGGEPLLHPEINQFVDEAFKQNLDVTIITNGLLFDLKKDDLLKLIKNNTLTFVFSLNGADASTHDTSRGVKGGFDKILNAISFLNNHEKRNKVKISISSTLTKENFNELIKIIKLKMTFPFDSFSFYYAREGVGNKREPISVDWITDFLKQKNKIVSLAKKVGLKEDNLSRGFMLIEKDIPENCFLPFMQCEIDYDGEVFACCHALENRKLINTSFGNVKEGFEKVWLGKNASVFRMNCQKISYPFCKDCTYKFLNSKIDSKLFK